MMVNILGTEYEIVFKDYNKCEEFKRRSIDGYCDCVNRELYVCNMRTYPDLKNEKESYCKKIEKRILRHEIIHAFLNESGLADSSFCYNESWATNEEMVDWIANQGIKLYKAWEQANAI